MAIPKPVSLLGIEEVPGFDSDMNVLARADSPPQEVKVSAQGWVLNADTAATSITYRAGVRVKSLAYRAA